MYTNDTQAIDAVLKGDKNSYETLIDRHKKMVYGIAWSHLGDADLSEDVAQETFIKAYTYLGTLREPEKFAGWLARIARNVCNSFRRSSKREHAFRERLTVLEKAETEPRAEERESISEPLWDSFADLPPVHREALTAFYIEGKSTADAALALGITENALKARLHRARIALREQLERRLEESLGELSPRGGFTRSVLLLLPLTPKGALATGLSAVFSKFLASLSFKIWAAAAGMLPVMGIYALMAKTDESSLAETPQKETARRRIRRGYRNAWIAMCAGMIGVWMLVEPMGFSNVFKLLAVLYAVLTVASAVSAVCRHRYTPSVPLKTKLATIAMWAIFCAAMTAIAFFEAPLITFAVAVLLISILAAFTTPATPPMLRQVGRNPFILAATAASIPEDNQPLDRNLTPLELKTFAKLLCGLGMVKSYSVSDGQLSITPIGMKASAFAAIGAMSGDSRIVIGRDGSCTASISETDLKAIREIFGADAEASKLEAGACRAIRYALGCFARGDAQTGLDAISVTVDQQAIAQTPQTARNHRAKMLSGIVMGVAVVAAFASNSAIGMIVYPLAGFALSALILAINLYLTRRQTPMN